MNRQIILLILGTLVCGVMGSLILSGIFYVDSTYANYRPNHDKLIGIIVSAILGFPIGMVIGFLMARFLFGRNTYIENMRN